MKPFKFSLETLLALRKAKLESQEQQLATAVTAYNYEQEKLRINRTKSTQTWANTIGGQHSDYLYLERLEKQSQKIDEKRHEAHLNMEQEQKRYNDIRKDLKVLEKLYDRQYHAYKKKLQQTQDEAIAEMVQAQKRIHNHSS